MTEEENVRRKVRALRHFYRDLINFVVMSVVLVCIWWIFDKSGNFWPKYVIVFWGIGLIFMAMNKGIFPLIFHRMTFLDEKWEEKKVKELKRRLPLQPKIPSDSDQKKK